MSILDAQAIASHKAQLARKPNPGMGSVSNLTHDIERFERHRLRITALTVCRVEGSNCSAAYKACRGTSDWPSGRPRVSRDFGGYV